MATPEELAAEAEAAKRAEAEREKARAGDLQKEIDRLKKKLEAKDAADEAATQAALAEQGKHKELADKFKAELDWLKPRLEKYEAMEKAEKDALLLKLPEDQRERWAKAETDLLRDHVDSVTKKDEKPTKPTKPGESGEVVKFEEMNFDEQDDLKKKNPVKWKLLFDDYNKRRGVKAIA